LFRYGCIGRSSRPAYFPRTSAWDNLRKSLKGEFDESVWDHLSGTTSAPFTKDGTRDIAVKVIDDRGNELLVVRSLDGAEWAARYWSAPP
jgi:adenine-specific DNA-methyltransferase